MERKNSYQTKQKSVIYDFFAKNPERQYSAKEVFESIRNSEEIGESTVYRLIKKLTEDGEIRRFNGKDVKSVVYQYADKNEKCHEHFHLKCTKCGALSHLDCAIVKDFEKHLGNHHGFSVDHMKTVIYGQCAQCTAKEL